MATEFWYPISGATHSLPAGHDGWTLTGGANKNVALQPGGGRAGPMTHDDVSTIVQATSAPIYQAVNIDWPSPVGVLTGVMTATFRHVHGAGAGDSNRGLRFVNAAGTGGNLIYDITNTTGSWVSEALADVTAAAFKPGGSAWATTDFANDETIFGEVTTSSAGANIPYVTSVWGQLGYYPPAGGLIFALGLTGLATVMDWSQFGVYLYWRRMCHPRHTIVTDDEARAAWREYREYRFPVCFDMGELCLEV